MLPAPVGGPNALRIILELAQFGLPKDKTRAALRSGGRLPGRFRLDQAAAVQRVFARYGFAAKIAVDRGLPPIAINAFAAVIAAPILIAVIVLVVVVARRPSIDVPAVVAKTRPGTVRITTADGLGSGFVAAPSIVLTNDHVVGNATEVEVSFADGTHKTGRVIKRDPSIDIAVVDVPTTGIPTLALGDAAVLAEGDPIVVIGSPLGLDDSVTQGQVTNVAHAFLGTGYVHIDAAVNPGNSGGPLINARSQVVGVVSMKRTDQSGIGLALPINHLYGRDGYWLIPSVRPDEAQWQRILEKVEEQNRAYIAEQRTQLQRPKLIGIAVSGSRSKRTVHVGIAQRFLGEPPDPVFSLRFVLEPGQLECPRVVKGDRWHYVSGKDLPDTRLHKWLNDNALINDIYVTVARVDVLSCRKHGYPYPSYVNVFLPSSSDKFNVLGTRL